MAQTTDITLIVGPQQIKLTINENLICTRCPFFFNAFSGGFLEAQTKTISFPDDDPELFEQLRTWLNDDEVPSPDASWISLVKFWFFGEKYHMDALQNDIVDALHQKYAAHKDGINIAFATLDHIAEHATARSPLRRLFADMLTNGMSLQHLPDRVESIPHEFLQDMIVMLKSYIHLNGPSNVSLLTNPIDTYYTSSAACKATATPREEDGLKLLPAELRCVIDGCAAVGETVHMCTSHNLTLCNEHRSSFRRHRRKMMSLTSPPYAVAVVGDIKIIDAQSNDSGFFCDGPACDTRLKGLDLPDWALMSGDRYHCLVCPNTDFCTVCVRGPLSCKMNGHTMLRMRSSFARKTVLTEKVPITERQRRLENKLCMRCAGDNHAAGNCVAEDATLPADILVED